MDTSLFLTYSKESMFTQFTSFALLAAISIQAVFGGLNETVSICLGGGHSHDTEELVEHCEFECSHHDDLFAPSHSDEDKEHDEHIEGCECTDLEFGLVALVTTLRAEQNIDELELNSISESVSIHQIIALHSRPPPRCDVDVGNLQTHAMIRSVRLRL